MEATIGVYITYYNERELLTELIQSVVSECSRPDEIIVYDDCSSFPAQDFVPKNASVKIIRGIENRGYAFGRNRLLDEASTDYVHFHDGDDFFLPGWLRQVRQVIKCCNGPEAVFTELALYKDGEVQPWQIGLEKLKVERDLLSFCIEYGMLAGAGTFSRELLMSMGGYSESLLQPDHAFYVRLATRCSSYALITEPLVGIRIRSDSCSHRLDRLDVTRNGLKALRLVAPEIPASHYTQIADVAISVSSCLYQLGDLEGAREGFAWAISLGRPSYRRHQWGYRVCARIVGPLYAEMIRTIYRKLPRRVRVAFRYFTGGGASI
jgi:glycosyltransferase involved in cell wall biosynthesis